MSGIGSEGHAIERESMDLQGKIRREENGTGREGKVFCAKWGRRPGFWELLCVD